MATLKVYGASDDLIETEGLPSADEFGAYADDPLVGKIVVEALGGPALDIFCIYNGCWTFAVAPAWEGGKEEYPEWFSIRREWGDAVSYSETLYIEVPDSATVKFERVKAPW